MRIEVGQPTPVSITFYTANTETAVNLNATPTVAVTHENGTVVLAAGAATVAGATGTYSFTLAAQPLPASLIVTWSGVPAGGVGTVTRTTYIDVIARFMCDLSEIRALDSLSDTTAYPTALLIQKRDAAEDLFESIVGARSAHYALEQLDGDSTYRRAYQPVESTWVYEPNLSRRLILGNLFPTKLLNVGFWDSVAVAYALDAPPPGSTQTQLQYMTDNYFLYSSGELERAFTAAGWPRGVRNIQIEYLYGQNDIPATLRDACLQYIRHLVLKTTSRISDRATSISNEGGTISLASAHAWDSPTGISEIDAVLKRFDQRPVSIA
jgi:hypothetical protein